jgi:hypothetical protein
MLNSHKIFFSLAYNGLHLRCAGNLLLVQPGADDEMKRKVENTDNV